MSGNNGEGDRDANNNLLSSSPPCDLSLDPGRGNMGDKNADKNSCSSRTESNPSPSSPGVGVVPKMGKVPFPSASLPVLCSFLAIFLLTMEGTMALSSGDVFANSGEAFGHEGESSFQELARNWQEIDWQLLALY